MAITPIEQYVPSYVPIPTIQPFTYRDGVTYWEKLNGIIRYMNRTVVPFVNDNITTISTDVADQITALIAQVNAARDEIINSSITVQDPVVSGIVTDDASQTRVTLDSIYASLSAVDSLIVDFNGVKDTVNSGRLSDSALNTKISGFTGINVRSFGAIGDGVTDDTAAIQAAINSAGVGTTIIFPPTGIDEFYKISSTISISTQGLRIIGVPRDMYSVSIRTSVVGLLMFSVKATGVVFENIGIAGKTNITLDYTNGQGCDVIGIEYFGDTDGNIDGAVRGVTCQYLGTAIIDHGRNLEVSSNTLISNCANGFIHNGKTAYNIGANADQNRGTVIRDTRFHNIGYLNTHTAIQFTNNANVLHCIIDGVFIDSNGLGRGIVFEGSTTAHARGVSIMNTRITELSNDGIILTNCDYPMVSDVFIMGLGTVDTVGISVTGCLYPSILGGTIRLTNRAIEITTSSNVMVHDINIVQSGQGGNGSAIIVDAATTGLLVNGVVANTPGLYFIDGLCSQMSVTDCKAIGYTTSMFSSSSISNTYNEGVVTYKQNKDGNSYAQADFGFELQPNLGKAVCFALSDGSNYASFVVDVVITSRGSVTGDRYAIVRRYIRVENGTLNSTVIGTDAVSGLTVNFTSYLTTGVQVQVTATEALNLGMSFVVRAVGSASSVRSIKAGKLA